ncbi:hypothetical protein PMAYCL1PPCAC_06234, partial [Pristionchus mayeri]
FHSIFHLMIFLPIYLILISIITANPLKRDDLSTTVTARLLCKGKPYLVGRLRLVVGKKQLDESRLTSNGTYKVSSSKYTAAYDGIVSRVMSKAGVQIFHTCNRMNCWEQEPEIEVPFKHVSTPDTKKPPYDLGRFELNVKFNDSKINCIKLN